MSGDDSMILAVDGEVREPEELAELTRLLRAELLELDVASIEEPTIGPPPDGAKGGGAAVVGQLLISLGPTTVGALIRTIRRWLSQFGARKVTVRIGRDEISVELASSEQQDSSSRRSWPAIRVRQPPADSLAMAFGRCGSRSMSGDRLEPGGSSWPPGGTGLACGWQSEP